MSGKCIITVPQDNQSKPSIVLGQRNLLTTWAESRRHRIMGWSDTE